MTFVRRAAVTAASLSLLLLSCGGSGSSQSSEPASKEGAAESTTTDVAAAVAEWFQGRPRDDWRALEMAVNDERCDDVVSAVEDLRLDLPSPDPGLNDALTPALEGVEEGAQACDSARYQADLAEAMGQGPDAEIEHLTDALAAVNDMNAALSEVREAFRDSGIPLSS